jgi:hypothetical protein
MKRVLVACEYSGIVRDAFVEKGFNAISCDILPTETKGRHFQGDVKDILYEPWDLIIAHPPCTRLTNAGVRWLHERNLWAYLEEACEFFNLFKNHPCKHIAIENPIPHKYAVEKIGKYDQIVQPWQFGHEESKAICLWLKNLPKLKPTKIMEKREQKVWRMGPSPDRAKERSRFYNGIAEAMVTQWGEIIK